MSFEQLTPDKILAAVEQAAGLRMTGLILPLPSYINRVYELRGVDGAQFQIYGNRPGILKMRRRAAINCAA